MTPMERARAGAWSERTAWARSLGTPLREFLTTESGGAAVLLCAAIAALVWANIDASSYESVWTTKLEFSLGSASLADDLRHWINDGLLTFFFFVVGLEARREFDMGELRERRRLALPLVAAIGGMALPVAIFLAFNGGRASAGGWGVAMSTDTAFALGMLALVGPRFSARLRAFVITLLVVDDLVSLVVISTAYTHRLDAGPLLIGVALFGIVLGIQRAGVRRGWAYALLGFGVWVAVRQSGVDPVIVGLAMGLKTYAYPAARGDLERASDLFRLFREQPTPELARSARQGLESALSPNERLQLRFHPWSSYVFVPLFALANAGVPLGGDFVSHAFGSPLTLGIVIGYVAGKPAGILAASWLARRVSGGRLRLPVGWGAAAGGGAAAGIGFTVSLLIANRAFHGEQLQDAKFGVLLAAVCASLLSWVVFRVIALLPMKQRIILMLGTADEVVDLDLPVDPEYDHIRGPEDAPVTIVEYGDFECPYCGRAEPVMRELLSDFGGDVRYVWRHLPLTDVHPHAELAAEAAEAAGGQGRFWEMHDLLLEHQDALRFDDLIGYAEQLGLDVDRFRDDLVNHRYAGRVARDVDSADASGVSGTPTFFINGRRHQGAYDIATLEAAVKAAGAKSLVTR
jgi:Na+/H+ antiporter NhaA